MVFTNKTKLNRDRIATKRETDRTDATSTMPKRPPQDELSSPAVSADINDLPGMSPRLPLQVKGVNSI
jgi:hypothetical protein